MKRVCCPIHNVKMRKVEIIWGLVNAGIEESTKEEVIFGGCCIPLDEKGEVMYKFGYICPECLKLFDKDGEHNFEYVIENGEVIPFRDS